MAEDRISKLSRRFSTHAVGRRSTSDRIRERRSFYLDTGVVERLDKTYRDLNHDLYPQNVSKSEFIETLIAYGLDRLPDLKAALQQAPVESQLS
jgi:hypothetical protein